MCIRDSPQSVTSLETLLARLASISLLLIAFLSLLLTGEIHALYAQDSHAGASDADLDSSPFAKPVVYASMLYHTVCGVVLYGYSYSRHLSGGWMTLGAIAHLLVAGAGMLLVMFGQGPGHVSRRTGADKRTSGFPFKNAEADRKRKR